MLETTLNGILNHRVTVEQPKHGFRIAVDTVLLAASVPAQAGQRVADFGCGVGGAMLCLGTRMPDVHVVGVEIQPDLAELCQRNIERNTMADRMNVVCGNIADFSGKNFDHVMMNPPYHDEARHDVSDNISKRTANASAKKDLKLWIAKANEALTPDGMLTLIQRADRLDDIVVETSRYFGQIEILPIVPKKDAPSKRVLIRAQKHSIPEKIHCPPLILHRDDGAYTDEAEHILRHATRLF